MKRAKEVDDHLLMAMQHRNQLNSIADQFVRLHSELPESDEAKELRSVILDGASYDEALRQIMRIKRQRSQ